LQHAPQIADRGTSAVSCGGRLRQIGRTRQEEDFRVMSIRRHAVAAALGLCVVASVPAFAAVPASQPWDGLIEVNSPKMDVAYLLPGADYRPYTKVMLDEPEVAFQKDWMRRMNEGMSRRVTEADAQKILASVRTNTADIFTDAFTKAGFTVVTEPGPDVLRVRSGVVDLYVNAPDTRSTAFSRTYTANAGEATLVLELRDSLSNALLGRVLDRRETRGLPGPSNSASNESEYRQLARQWAATSVKGLTNLKSHSPIPDPLAPGQKLN
jgi:hypothetical protein